MKIAPENDATRVCPQTQTLPTQRPPVPVLTCPVTTLPPGPVQASSASTAREQDVTSAEKEHRQEEGCREPEMPP